MKHDISIFRAAILAPLIAGLITLVAIGPALSCVPEDKGIKSYCRNQSSFSRILNVVWPDSTPYQIAVVAGIAHYPNLPKTLQLPPVDYDVDQLSEILSNKLGFDEVLILKDNYFTEKTLRYVFSEYIPAQLRSHKNSQVLFAYSGHGADYQDSGYLFLANTTTIEINRPEDLAETIDLDELKVLLKQTMNAATHFLVLLNSCKGGYFVSPQTFPTTAFGAAQLEARGAHGITAGGRNNNVHANPNVGSGKGSVFFEMVFAALSGSGANLNGTPFPDPAADNGILSSLKLEGFLDGTIERIENYGFGPQMARLTPGEGYFFFITDEERAKRELRTIYPKNWNKVFGAAPDEASPHGNDTPVKLMPKAAEPRPKPPSKSPPIRNPPPSPEPTRVAAVPSGYFCSPTHHLHRLGGAFSGLPERRETSC